MSTRIALASLALLPFWSLAGCGDNEHVTPAVAASAGNLAADPPVELDTFIHDSIQIDVLTGGPGDANLYVGKDPADQTDSVNLPAGGPGSYIDWQNLAGDFTNHRLLDTDDPTERTDLTAFPRSNSCVGSANVLAKMDLAYVGAASNTKFVYLAALRSANNGDAGYYWLFTRKAPHLDAGAAPCNTGEKLLTYDISGPNSETGAVGDVLIAGHFKPSSAPLLTVYTATKDANGVQAVNAIDFTSDLWTVNPAGVAAVAVNTTPTAPGDWGTSGVKSLVGSNLDKELFAEAAIPLSVFSGGSSCGSIYYGSVITRSSGSGGTNPDLKDLAGPARFDFGSLDVTASMTATCNMTPSFALDSATDNEGSALGSPQCSWTFDDGLTATTCSGTHTFATAGSHHGTITVTDPGSGCVQTYKTPDVLVYPPPAVTATVTEGCVSTFGYSATASGGTPAGVSYAWTFTGPGTVTPSSTTASSGTGTVTVGGSYTASVTVTDLRTDGLTCTASNQASGRALLPLSVSLKREAGGGTCPSLTSDAVTYAPVASGGNGSYTFTWDGYTCTGTSCTIDPPDSTFCDGPINLKVGLADSSGLCAGVTSETETYTKTTTVTATDN